MTMPSYVYQGTTVQTTVTFTLPGSSTPVDPSTITLKYQTIDGGPTTTWTFGGTGSITKTATGIYSALLNTSNLPGTWTVEWIGTGACAAVNVASWTVASTPL